MNSLSEMGSLYNAKSVNQPVIQPRKRGQTTSLLVASHGIHLGLSTLLTNYLFAKCNWMLVEIIYLWQVIMNNLIGIKRIGILTAN